jgi:hypothetical protein
VAPRHIDRAVKVSGAQCNPCVLAEMPLPSSDEMAGQRRARGRLGDDAEGHNLSRPARIIEKCGASAVVTATAWRVRSNLSAVCRTSVRGSFMSMDPFVLPPALPALVECYAVQKPEPVRFRIPSWEAALADVSGKPTRLLSDSTITAESVYERYRSLGDRVVTSDAVANVCSKIDLADDESVVAAFVLVMVWGSGTTNSRSLRNTHSALKNVKDAADILRDSALALRAATEIDSAELATAHRSFSLPGLREPFFTKWFSFAGVNPKRPWQPLILDSRVRATLHTTLDVWLNNLARERNGAYRYIAYLTALHTWAEELPEPVTASRLEWIFFMQNGKPL